jgi:hypothetical protein
MLVARGYPLASSAQPIVELVRVNGGAGTQRSARHGETNAVAVRSWCPKVHRARCVGKTSAGTRPALLVFSHYLEDNRSSVGGVACGAEGIVGS